MDGTPPKKGRSPMILSKNLTNKRFTIAKATSLDLKDYISVKKHCYEKYVDEYYGGWVDDVQIEMNSNTFHEMMGATCFEKVMLNGKTVGFWGFDELDDAIDKITVQVISDVQGQGLGACYLEQLVVLSVETNKPILLQVFKSNPARYLYEKFGFVVYDETASHYLMKYVPRS